MSRSSFESFLLGGLAVAIACAERVIVWPLSVPPGPQSRERDFFGGEVLACNVNHLTRPPQNLLEMRVISLYFLKSSDDPARCRSRFKPEEVVKFLIIALLAFGLTQFPGTAAAYSKSKTH